LKKYQFHYHLTVNPDKPVIIFLHGFMGNLDEFDAAIKLLSADFSYLTIDLPGHGKTQVLGDDDCYQMESTALALINLLDDLDDLDDLKSHQPNKYFLVGYSMGGRLALYLALHFPQRFIKVILVSASPGLATDEERLARKQSDLQIARKLSRNTEKKDFANFLNYWYSQPIFGNIKNHPQYPEIIQSRLRNNPELLAKSLQFMSTGCQPSLWENLQYNHIPLLLLVGELDEKFVAINNQMNRQCKSSKLAIFPQVSHSIHWENSLAFTEYIKDFFQPLHPTPYTLVLLNSSASIFR